MIYNLLKARLVIFDFDGVIIEKVSDGFPAALLKEFLKNGDILEDGAMVKFKSTNWIGELEKMEIDVTNVKILEAISRKRHEYNRGQLNMYGWVRRLIPKLAENKKLAILTNNSMVAVTQCLGTLEKFFSSIKTWENTPKLKPAPDGILCICRELGVSPFETLMVGDGEEDLIAAEKSGANSLIVRDGEHFSRLVEKY